MLGLGKLNLIPGERKKEEFNEETRVELQKKLDEVVAILKSEISSYYLYKDISARVKTVESANRKLITRKIDSWRELSDYCGAAIIIHPLKTTEEVMEILRNLHKTNEKCKNFKIVQEEIKGPKDSSQFAYRAIHCDALYGDCKIEIQVRTCYQDIWNCISHQAYELQRLKGYDQAHSLPRELHQISSLLEISEEICSSTIRQHGKEVPDVGDTIDDTDELKLLIAKKLKYNGPINDWEFNVAYEALKSKNKIKTEEVEREWKEFASKLKGNDHNNLIFKFSEYIILGQSFDPNSPSNTKLIVDVLNRFEKVLNIRSLLG
ncbi:hypothetical protein DICPUDRAFT_149613 [Dictyostelium purpureum]|uniref:RelA/SpoT domain-containing protein n=1 Tax=Dictyostelium purpureum TaxID=5786 RepID=F0ZE47_DICPU|nr:uncharacterized protein DICPUDRAFT_149613 [Dictyostelium purpureum]EGC37784.1 hypothetical protein DICPUDRAFT_149613 [Dictyostelium purpureum]|eukprot:XP_003285723.1 hypothetical protein DICPUDRAFT_149613 [Dictyostelium purpureum]